MKVVVGLGNPGSQYAGTRHNVGCDVLAEFSRRHGAPQPKLRFEAEIVELSLEDEKLMLVAPQAYMNNSGQSVRKLVDFYRLPLEDLLVVCDDLNLETGRLRMRSSGSAGGQKGLGDIIRHLGTQEFSRLRIGIGRPPGRMTATSYVLRRFRQEEREQIDVALAQAADGVEIWRRAGVGPAMNRVNAPTSDTKSTKSKQSGDDGGGCG